MSSRKDFRIGRLRFITRPYTSRPQYGCLLWSARKHHWAFDVWVRQTLFTITKDAYYD